MTVLGVIIAVASIGLGGFLIIFDLRESCSGDVSFIGALLLSIGILILAAPMIIFKCGFNSISFAQKNKDSAVMKNIVNYCEGNSTETKYKVGRSASFTISNVEEQKSDVFIDYYSYAEDSYMHKSDKGAYEFLSSYGTICNTEGNSYIRSYKVTLVYKELFGLVSGDIVVDIPIASLSEEDFNKVNIKLIDSVELNKGGKN